MVDRVTLRQIVSEAKAATDAKQILLKYQDAAYLQLHRATFAELNELSELIGMYQCQELHRKIENHPRYTNMQELASRLDHCNEFPGEIYIDCELMFYRAVSEGFLQPADLGDTILPTLDRLAREEAELMDEMPTFTAGYEQRIQWGQLRGIIPPQVAAATIIRIQENRRNRPVIIVQETIEYE